jgi:hypothetical protein
MLFAVSASVVESIDGIPVFYLLLFVAFPVPDLRQVLAVLINVMLMFNELVMYHLFEVVPLATQVRQAVYHVLDQVEPVQLVLHAHVEGGGDRAFFFIAPDVHFMVGPAIGQPVNQPGVSMKAEDDVLVFGEKGVVVRSLSPCGCSVRVAGASGRRR